MSGICYLVQYKTLEFGDDWGKIIIGYNKPLNPLDVPTKFRIYLTTINEWKFIVFDDWFGHEQPLTFEITTKNFPTGAMIHPLYREYYYPLESKTGVPDQNMNLESCLKPNDILRVRDAQNCSNNCIPINYSSLFNTSEIKVCKSFVDHFCAFNEVGSHIFHQLSFCMKPTVEKYFKGRVKFRSGEDNIEYPETFNENKKKSAMIIISWNYHNQLTTIIKEKLVYDSKDLLAWLGGALGIFLGYSFFDFAKHIIDIAFYCAHRKMNS